MDTESALKFVSENIDTSAIPALMDYIRVPSVSPGYDADWATNGHMVRAMNILLDWVRSQEVAGLTIELLEHPKCPPIVYIEVKPTTPGLPTALIYGHMDKQPPFTGWSDFCGAYNPAIQGDLLYGRGSSDDGYAITTAILSIKACQVQGKSHGRCIILIENEEESDSENLLSNLSAIKEKIGDVSLIVCLDSGAADYNRLWLTTSLRGYVEMELNVKVLESGVHSGDSSGVIPSSFRVLRILLDRVEDAETGIVLVPELHVGISPDHFADTVKIAQFAGEFIYKRFPFVEGGKPVTTDLVQLLLNETYRPTLCVTGASGLPAIESAGNVLRPETTVKLSFRSPPGADEEAARLKIVEILESNPPYAAKVSVRKSCSGKGWAMLPMNAWLRTACQSASQSVFHADPMNLGEGGSVPLIRSLQDMYPRAEVLVTGCLGAQSNAHGPNENLSIPYYKKFTACFAHILHAHSLS